MLTPRTRLRLPVPAPPRPKANLNPLHIGREFRPAAEVNAKALHPTEDREQVSVGDREAVAYQIILRRETGFDEIETPRQLRLEEVPHRLRQVCVEQRARSSMDLAGDEVEPFLKLGALQGAIAWARPESGFRSARYWTIAGPSVRTSPVSSVSAAT
ncbi:hypothetical protein EN41_04810 [Agrobacterium tumefaciens]|nr:hypothetical protein EN41_04810 [Agrobacterium tumefaciens]